MDWLEDYLDDVDQLGGLLPKHNDSSSSSSGVYRLQWDTWIRITENQSLDREMVYQPRRQSVIIYGTLLSASSVLINLLLFVLVARKPHSDHCYPSKWLVLNFTAAQLLLAAFVVPLAVNTEHEGAWTFGPALCRVWLLAQVFLVALSIWALFMVTMDRFLYVVTPLTYSRKMTGRWKVAAMIGSTWLVSLVTLVPIAMPLTDPDYILDEVCAIGMDKHHAFVLASGAFFVPCVMTVVMTLALVIASIQAKLQQSRLRSDGIPDDENTERSCLAGRLCPDVTYATYAEYHDVGNVTCTVTAVNLFLLLMWGPFYVTNLLIPFCSGMCVDPTLWSLFLWLGYTACGLCPLIWFFDRDIRRQCKALVRCEPRTKNLTGTGTNTGSWYFMDTSVEGKSQLKTHRV